MFKLNRNVFRTTLPGKKPLRHLKTHNKIAAEGSPWNVKKAKKYFDKPAFKTIVIIQTAQLSVPMFSCFYSDAVWLCMSGGWGSAIQEHHQHYDEEHHGYLWVMHNLCNFKVLHVVVPLSEDPCLYWQYQ